MSETVEVKMAPVQGYTPGIPWSMHLEAYDVYRKKYGGQQALIEGGCRGGFGTRELDEFIPGWRDKVSEIGKLRSELDKIQSRAMYFELRYAALRALFGDLCPSEEEMSTAIEAATVGFSH